VNVQEQNAEEMARVEPMGDASDSPTAGWDEAAPGVEVSFTFTRSKSFARFAGALAKAQREMEGASKDSLNPHFKNRYADLAAVWDACREPLGKHGIAVLQPPCAKGPTVTVTTLLVHESGEFIQSDLTMTAGQNTPQGIGSCITYARRYALQSMVGIAPEDDDGNAASQGSGNGNGARVSTMPAPRVETPQARVAPSTPAGFDDWLADMEATADEGTEALERAWKSSQPYFRKHLTDTDKMKWELLKARAKTKTESISA
jgi:hypothetical protein